MNIIRGAELSTFKTTAISLGRAKKEDRNGQKNRYMVVTMQDVDSPADKSREFFFEDELDTELGPNLIDILKNFAADDPRGATNPRYKGMKVVNIKAAKESQEFEVDGVSVLQPYLRWPGGMFETYKLKKGPCYANDIDGNRIKDANGNDVIVDSIQVFTQIKMLKPDANGNMETIYFKKFDLNSRGRRMERRFYQQAVNQSANTQGVKDEDPEGDEQPAGETLDF